MNRNRIPGSRQLLVAALAAFSMAPLVCRAQATGASYQGQAVPIGKGSAHTVVRADAQGKPVSIGVVFTETALEGLPAATKGTDFEYALPMPKDGPRTAVNHVVVNWNPAGHPPPKVYDVPHFDFHFYLVSRRDRENVRFKSEAESGDPSQQPAAEQLPAGYVVPPGTAVGKMGVHAIDPAGPEFNGKPFMATFIHGFYKKRHTFFEPMASLDFLKSKPTFSAPVTKPSKYLKGGEYPSSYSINYDAASRSYEVLLEGLR